MEARNKVKGFLDKIGAGTWTKDADEAPQRSAETELETISAEVTRLAHAYNLEQQTMAGGAGDEQRNQGNPSGISVNVIPERKPDTEQQARKSFRLIRAANFALNPQLKRDGLEGEMATEAMKEARSLGLPFDPGGISIPSFIVRNSQLSGVERRDLTAGSATSMGNTIATELGPMVEFLDPEMPIRQLGANIMTGLTSNMAWPRKTARATATFKTEVAAGDESTPTSDLITITPKRLPGFIEVSLQLLAQSSIDVENDVRMDLNEAVARALETAAINGSGSDPVPRGILNVSGIGDVVMGTNGGVPTWAKIVALETALSTTNANKGSLGYLTTPGIAGLLKTTIRDTAGNGFIWEGPNNGNGTINGYRAMTSTLVPSTLTKGTASGTCHAVIFGNWRELVIGQWGGINLVVNPYSRDTEGLVRFTVNSFWDLAVRHAASFSAIKDALLS